jgi:Ca2+-transporting ATPase
MVYSTLADGIFVEGSKFKANEAAMTGEPLDIQKDHVKDPFLLSGTRQGGAS